MRSLGPNWPFMPRFYFHQHLNGHLAIDRRGHWFANVKEACEHAVQRLPATLRKTIRSACDTHLATAISDGKKTLGVVRGKVIIQKYPD
jgi:hypothetical protein